MQTVKILNCSPRETRTTARCRVIGLSLIDNRLRMDSQRRQQFVAGAGARGRWFHCHWVLMRMRIGSVGSMNPRVVRRYDSCSLHKGTQCHRAVRIAVPIAVWIAVSIDVPIVEEIEQSKAVRISVGVLYVISPFYVAVYP